MTKPSMVQRVPVRTARHVAITGKGIGSVTALTVSSPPRLATTLGGAFSPSPDATAPTSSAGCDGRRRGVGFFSEGASADVLFVVELRELVEEHRPDLSDRLETALSCGAPVAAMQADELVAAVVALTCPHTAACLEALVTSGDLATTVAEVPPRLLGAILVLAEREADRCTDTGGLHRLARVVAALRRARHRRRCEATAAHAARHEVATDAS